MAVPFQITGAGNKDARYVFRVKFSQDLATAPNIEAWDSTQTYPACPPVGATNDNEIFTGTTGNSNLPMLYAAATTNASPGSDWKPSTATSGGANPNRLSGSDSYVTDPTTPSAGESIYFNLGVEVPYDVTTPTTTSLGHLIQIRYTYSGSVPELTFYANEGSEDSPTWTEIVPGTHGIRYCDANTDWSSGSYQLTLPESGTVDAPELGITS